MADGKRRYKSDRKDYKISVKLSEKDMDILKAALKRTGMTASAYIRELIRTGGNIIMFLLILHTDRKYHKLRFDLRPRSPNLVREYELTEFTR